MPKIRSLAELATFRETIKAIPIGTKVHGNVNLRAVLAKSTAGRHRDPGMIGTVEGYDELQLRVLVRWDHPDFKDGGNLEPLSPFYIDTVED